MSALPAVSTYPRVVALPHNVLNRVPFSLGTGADTTLTTYARNNLFRGITIGNLNAASGNAWDWRDNLLDTASLWQYCGGVANGNNAYRNCPQSLTAAGGGNLALTALTYTADSWGRGWYATATPSLLNAGSRTAAAAGLYHYTTQTNQTKEANTPVDIGFHHVVANTSTGRPVDTDGDGLPDYFEDANGDGVFQATETHPASQDTDGDGLSDAAELAYGLDPRHPDTDGNGTPDGPQHVNTGWYAHGETASVVTPSVWEWPVSRLGELTLLLAQGTQRAHVEIRLSTTECGHVPPHWNHTGDAVRWAIEYPQSPPELSGNTTVQQRLDCLQCDSPGGGNCTLLHQWLDVSEATAQVASFLRVRLAATKGTDCFDRHSSISVRVRALKAGVGLTAYRPQTEGPGYGNPFQRRAVPEGQEESPGAGIRVNGDDDNGNGLPDHNDTTVHNENDLIEIGLDVEPPSLPTGFRYFLKRSNAGLRVWAGPNKGVSVLTAGEEVELTFDDTSRTAWVENRAGGAATLELEARSDSGAVLCRDRVHFYPFTSVVIALGGEGQAPADPPLEPGNHGTFQLAIQLYELGYDVHMYDEDNVDGDGQGAVYGEVERAVQRRNVSQVAIFGYSHGGGSTHDLARRLHNHLAPQANFTIAFTGYIDAVTQEAITQENRRPPGSGFHVNLYQVGSIGDGWLDGGPIDNPPGADFEDNVDDPAVTHTHFTIDDDANVLNEIRTRLAPRINR